MKVLVVSDENFLCSLGWVTCGLGMLGHFVAGILGNEHMTVPILIVWISASGVLGMIATIIVSEAQPRAF